MKKQFCLFRSTPTQVGWLIGTLLHSAKLWVVKVLEEGAPSRPTSESVCTSLRIPEGSGSLKSNPGLCHFHGGCESKCGECLTFKRIIWMSDISLPSFY